MKKTIVRLLAATLMAVVAATTTIHANAQGKKKSEAAEAPAKETKEKDPNRKLPFHGKIVEVNKTDKTIKIGTRIFKVTSETEITKTEKPATLDDATIGEIAGGSYKDNNGSLELVKIRLGPKPGTPEKADEAQKKSKKS